MVGFTAMHRKPVWPPLPVESSFERFDAADKCASLALCIRSPSSAEFAGFFKQIAVACKWNRAAKDILGDRAN